MASNRRTNEARLLEPFLAKGPSELPDNALGVAVNDLFNTLSTHKIGSDHNLLYFTKEEIANMILGAYNPNIMVPATAGYGLVIEGNVIRLDVTNGWTPISSTWAYASATAINVPSGAAAIYAVGDKIKLTQSTVKYFYIVGVTDTLLTITGGSDYTLVNAAISAISYSHQTSPVGFPQWFNYVPLWTASVTNPTLGTGTLVGRFSINGKTCTTLIRLIPSSTTTYGSGTYALTVPLPSGASTLPAIGTSRIRDNAVADYIWFALLPINTNSLLFQPMAGAYGIVWTPTVPFTFGSGDTHILTISYEVA